MNLPTHGSLDEYTGFLLRKVSLAAFSSFSSVCEKDGLHPMHFGMLTILEAEGPISQRVLSDRAGVDASTMVQRMDALEAKGLVKRARSTEDRRSYEIELSPEGRAVLRRLRKQASQGGERLFGVLDEQERAQLHALLLKVAEGLDRRA
ncbi:MAG: MarR family transcriptional regulator [Actinomycetota bacterium]|nr:MarR family transcriptional regulator [Actinomycetota bacterium]